ncbi:hypothetical protein ACJROX_24185 [Pseudalkalibacillus sp. A8]|uniref:hypothetical protein n=1 Tax=Pseudalkalibacillus sp. A8 TaxID=3382641 RepID=UPI0038B69639
MEQKKRMSLIYMNGEFQISDAWVRPVIQKKTKQETEQQDRFFFLSAVSRLRGSDYIRDAYWNGNEAVIRFENSDHVSPEYLDDYDHYFSSKMKIGKLLLDNLVYLFKELPYISMLKIAVPYQSSELVVHIHRNQLEKYLQTDFSYFKNVHRCQFHFHVQEREVRRFVHRYVNHVYK